MPWDDCGRKQLVPNMRFCCGIYMEELKKTTRNLIVVSVPAKFELGTCRIQVKESYPQSNSRERQNSQGTHIILKLDRMVIG